MPGLASRALRQARRAGLAHERLGRGQDEPEKAPVEPEVPGTRDFNRSPMVAPWARMQRGKS